MRGLQVKYANTFHLGHSTSHVYHPLNHDIFLKVVFLDISSSRIICHTLSFCMIVMALLDVSVDLNDNNSATAYIKLATVDIMKVADFYSKSELASQDVENLM